MASKTNKEWYKHGWGLAVAIILFPYFLVWYAWAKSSWNKGVKIALTAVVGLFVLMVLVAMATTDTTTTSTQNNDSKPATEQQQPAENNEKQETKPISQSDAEDVCQDANFLQNYISISDTSIVTLSYNPYFTEVEGTAKQLIWNGEDKTTDKAISFICDVDYKDGEVEVIGLAIDGRGVMGIALEQDLQEAGN